MRKFCLLVVVSAFATITFGQGITSQITVTTNEDMGGSIGGTHQVKVVVRNNAAYSYVVGKSVYAVVVHHIGTSSSGDIINTTSELKTPLAAGQSKTFVLDVKPPKLEGVYKTTISFNWGNRVISNVVTKNFEIEGNYEANITAKQATYNSSGTGNVEIAVQNSGDLIWPEGDYSLKFALVKAAPGSSRQDQNCFNIEPRVMETWEGFEPGQKDAILLRGFKLPQTKGDYRVKVYVMLEGKQFVASGNPKEFTFRIN